MNKEALIKVIKKITSNRFPQWVLFSQGTYVLFDEPLNFDSPTLENMALLLLQEQGRRLERVHTYCGAGIISIEELQGWIVSCPFNSGFYTFVHSSEFEDPEPSEIALSVQSRNKCLRDCELGEVMHVQHQALPGHF